MPVLPALAAIAASPVGQAGLGALGAYGTNKLYNYLFGRPQSEQAQEYLYKMLQQPQQFQQVNFAPIAQEAQRQYLQDVVPGLAERFSGSQRSSAFQQALGQSGSDLASRLAAMRAQHEVGQQGAQMQQQGINQQLLPILAQYLTSQQGFGLGRQELAQRQRQQALGGLEALGSLGTGQSTEDINRQVAAVQPALQGQALSQGQSFTPIQQPPNQWAQATGAILSGLGRGAEGFANLINPIGSLFHR